MKIEITTKPYKKMRYETLGDYYFKKRKLMIDIAKMNDPLYEIIVAIHELWEWYRITEAGIKIEDIDKFDMESDSEDPGLSPLAPYQEQHKESVKLEELMCKLAGIKYEKYYNNIK